MSNTTKSVQWVTVADAVSQLGTSKRTLFRMIAAGKINTINEGTKRLVEVRPVEASAEAEPVETRIGMLALTKSNDQLQQALGEARTALRDAETRTARAHSTAMRWAAAAATLALVAGISGTSAAWQREKCHQRVERGTTPTAPTGTRVGTSATGDQRSPRSIHCDTCGLGA